MLTVKDWLFCKSEGFIGDIIELSVKHKVPLTMLDYCLDEVKERLSSAVVVTDSSIDRATIESKVKRFLHNCTSNE